MTEKQTVFSPGTLWQRLCETTDRAIACGALVPIDTRQCMIEDGGVPFAVRIAENLRRKAAQHRGGGPAPENPFLPPEPELTVATVSDSHTAVLNKFNVVEHHLLVVTRRFEEQESLLTEADFRALWRCMGEYEALGFYNGGRVAGASQRHKHLQTIPLPLTAGGPSLPVEPLVDRVRETGPTRVPGLAFRHRFLRLPEGLADHPGQAATWCRVRYLELLAELGLPAAGRDGVPWQAGPYNLLLTRRWMMVVPRSREHCGSVSINAMGFAGSLFVRDRQELEQVRDTGPMEVLRAVT